MEAAGIQNTIRVVGTAGHVDHGKSSLIEALTGTHPDRLKEEQARQMTIDLGFGWLTLPDGREIGIVDVPGHSDFIENMVAGVSGIDAVLLVIAADEGIRPQTTEHLAIIDLLGVRGGVIALTKADLVDDEDWWGMLGADIHAMVRGTTLQEAPLVRVSSRTGSGLPELLEQLSNQLNKRSDRPDLDRPRLPLDRVFTMEGFGTVVTGTLIDGQLAVGDEVEVLPLGLRGRVRGLQHHRRKVERASPGARTAVNISGLEAAQLKRGDVLTHPRAYTPTRRVDAQLNVLSGASRDITHNTEVKLLIGTTETMATLRLLGTERLAPGEKGLIQLELEHSVVCARGDAFILRQPSPSETLGGGAIIDDASPKRHRRFDAAVIGSLQARSAADAPEVLLEVVRTGGTGTVREIAARARLSTESARGAIKELVQTGRIVALLANTNRAEEEQILLTAAQWQELVDKMQTLAAQFHAKFPLRAGIPREELKNQTGLEVRVFTAAVNRHVAEGRLVSSGSVLALPGHHVRFDAAQQAAIDSLLKLFHANPGAPPSVRQCKAAIGEEIFVLLKEKGELVAVSAEVVFLQEDYQRMVSGIRGAIEARGQISLAEVRDLLSTSRKYAQALLEHLDEIGVTRRSGEARVLAR